MTASISFQGWTISWQDRVRAFEARFDYGRNDEWKKTEELKAQIATFRAAHPGEGLSLQVFGAIAEWKLRKQRKRTEKYRADLTESLLSGVTECVFGLQHEDQDALASVQVGMLASLPGVGTGLASAILALTYPALHGVADFRVWLVLFGREKRFFTVQDYIRYLREVRPFARDAGWPVQKADFMIWSY